MKFSHNNMAAWKTDETGRFIIHRALHLGTRASRSEYVVEDTQTGNTVGAKNLKIAKCIIVNERDGVKLAPFFTENAHQSCRATGDINDYNLKLLVHGEWQGIKS